MGRRCDEVEKKFVEYFKSLEKKFENFVVDLLNTHKFDFYLYS